MMEKEKWQRFVDKQQTGKERKAFLQWLQSQSDDEIQKSLKEGWDEKAPAMPVATDARLRKALSIQPALRRPVYRIGRKAALAAACVLLLVMATFMYRLMAPATHEVMQYTMAKRHLYNESANVRLLTLPDNSKIWLTPASSIDLPDDYNQFHRTVTLSGEAYFEVNSNAKFPFIVNTEQLQTTVLGTHFNMSAYRSDDFVSVTLTQGKIAVQMHASTRDSVVILAPEHKLVYNKNARRVAVSGFSAAAENDWKTGALVFDDVPLESVFERLSGRFHKKIFYAKGGYAAARFTGTYHHESFPLIMDNIAYIHNFSYRSKGDSVWIRRK
ncbi:FecR family protein [Deminuibacter soli]|uniref:DUF4974 domain-containing protein n=1 Tax=Deminuibacter soli TaxID=2291815 RepID=A0A3E1NGA1_9BACT|nr:FecR domain-containing protein [Deminuibacter soli]RFM26861.1 DUF4974 domain-containing protein [Deminuibacter soli]